MGSVFDAQACDAVPAYATHGRRGVADVVPGSPVQGGKGAAAITFAPSIEVANPTVAHPTEADAPRIGDEAAE